jgi:hypothetical protein
MWFLQNGLPVAVVITGSFLVSASAIAKPLPPKECCRPISKSLSGNIILDCIAFEA